MSLPVRKPTRLPEYSYSNGGSYFLTICTQNREKLFSRIVPGAQGDYPYNGDGRYLRVELTPAGQMIEKQLKKARRNKLVRVENYIIMPDHLHIIVSVSQETIQEKGLPSTERIPCFVSMFKRNCNRELGRNVFQRGYHDHVIRGIADCEALDRYILYNPANWYFREHQKS